MKNKMQSVYQQAERFATLTKVFIISGNITRAKKCFAVAEQLLEAGSQETKTAITNVFLFSVSAFMELHKCSIHNLFPASLKKEYSKQILVKGI